MSVNLSQQESPYICNYLSDNLFCHLGHCFAETASSWLTLFHLWYSWDLLGSGVITLGSSWFKDLDDFYIIFFQHAFILHYFVTTNIHSFQQPAEQMGLTGLWLWSNYILVPTETQQQTCKINSGAASQSVSQSKRHFREATPGHTETVLLAVWTIIRNISLWFPQMMLDWLFPWPVPSTKMY